MRPSTLRTKIVKGKTYWVVRHRGSLKYLGRVDDVPREEALQRLEQWVNLGGAVEASSKVPPIRLVVLFSKFTVWLDQNRSKRTAVERRYHLQRFLRGHGDCWAHSLRLKDLDTFLDTFKDPLYKRHHAVSIKAMVRWGRRYGHLPQGFNPYEGLELPPLPPKHLVESALPTQEEVEALLAHADPDLADLIRFYRGVGCRTAEALKATVADFSPRSQTITLSEHKTARTTGKIRVLVLEGEVFEIVSRRARGKSPDAPIFTTPHRGWKMNNLSAAWITLRTKAEVRQTITPYSFRHLWASEAIESGLDLCTVARLMGSSTAVVEKYYAHFRTQSLQEAQRRVSEHRARRSEGTTKG